MVDKTHKVHTIISETYENNKLSHLEESIIHNYRLKYKYNSFYTYYRFCYIISTTVSWYEKDWKTSSKIYKKFRLNYRGWLLLILTIVVGILIYEM